MKRKADIVAEFTQYLARVVCARDILNNKIQRIKTSGTPDRLLVRFFALVTVSYILRAVCGDNAPLAR